MLDDVRELISFDKTGIPFEDLYLFCKHRNKSFNDFLDLYNIRRSIWQDMDEFDECLKNRNFRFFYKISRFYRKERSLRKLAETYWSGKKIIPDDLALYYDMSKRYDNSFEVFYRLLKWKEIYLQ